jgi:hypothetical protein
MLICPREKLHHNFVAVLRPAGTLAANLDVARNPIIIRLHIHPLTAPAKGAGDGLVTAFDDLHHFPLEGSVSLCAAPRHPAGEWNDGNDIPVETGVQKVRRDDDFSLRTGRTDNAEPPLGHRQLSDDAPPIGTACLPAPPAVGTEIANPAALVKLENPPPPEIVHKLAQGMKLAPILDIEMPGKLFQTDPRSRILRQVRQNTFLQ